MKNGTFSVGDRPREPGRISSSHKRTDGCVVQVSAVLAADTEPKVDATFGATGRSAFATDERCRDRGRRVRPGERSNGGEAAGCSVGLTDLTGFEQTAIDATLRIIGARVADKQPSLKKKNRGSASESRMGRNANRVVKIRIGSPTILDADDDPQHIEEFLEVSQMFHDGTKEVGCFGKQEKMTVLFILDEQELF